MRNLRHPGPAGDEQARTAVDPAVAPAVLAVAPAAGRAGDAGAARAGRAAGSRATCRRPTTPSAGSPAGCRTAGSTTWR